MSKLRRLTSQEGELRRLYLDEGSSIPDVAKHFDVSYSTARAALMELGIPLRSRAEGIRAAGSKLGSGLRGKKRAPFSPDHRRRIAESARQRGEEIGRGWRRKPSGYVELTRGPHKGESLHRLIAELTLGRPLRDDEVVHHKNSVRDDNRPENLEVMSRSAHARLHARERDRERNALGQFKKDC